MRRNRKVKLVATLGPASAAPEMLEKLFDAGVDGVIINMPGYVPGAITKVGEALRPMLA